jgi:hypothetical protein
MGGVILEVSKNSRQRVAGKQIRNASRLNFLFKDRNFFVKTQSQFTENQRNSLTGWLSEV